MKKQKTIKFVPALGVGNLKGISKLTFDIPVPEELQRPPDPKQLKKNLAKYSRALKSTRRKRTHQVPCPKCEGTGVFCIPTFDPDECTMCKGTGKIRESLPKKRH